MALSKAEIERMEYIKQQLEIDNKIRVEVPVHETTDYRGTKVIRRFNDSRFGYKFTNGVAMVEPKVLYKFKEAYPNWIYSDNNKTEGEK